MAIDYTKMISPPPEDLVEKIICQGAFKHTDRVIFNAEYVYVPLTGRKERMAKCHCTACNEEWFELWAEDEMGCGRHGRPYGIELNNETVYSGNSWICPECGAVVKLTHISEINPNSRYNKGAYISVFGKIGSSFTVTDYCVIQQFHKDGHKTYQVEKYTAYIFETKKKCVQLQGFEKNFNYVNFRRDWWQKSRCDSAIVDGTCYIYPYDTDFLQGTTMENSRLDKYLDTHMDENNKIFPVKYLRLYQKHNQLETIMDLGLEYMVREEISRLSGSYYNQSVGEAFKDADWKQKSPYKILGYDRTEMKIIKTAQLAWEPLQKFKIYKNLGIPFTAENINLFRRHGGWEADMIIKANLPLIKTLKYLEKQKQYFSYLEDYWRMAERFGLDTTNPIIRFPKNLRQKHDELVQKIKWNESKKLQETFSQLAEKLDAEKFSDGNICISIAKNEGELITEGRLLNHCVGGYGKNHCEGRSIFFVRRAEQPETPWYTLQVNLKEGKQLQLHGYNNDRDTPIPQEVHDFVDYWLKNVFRRFDVQTMKFIDKPKAAATA